MTKNDVKRLRGLLAVAEADIQAVKAMVKTPDTVHHERLRCHVRHLLESAGDMLAMLDDIVEENQITIDLEANSNGAANVRE